MSDYTPTTERVRNSYANDIACFPKPENVFEANARAEAAKEEFDRWLASVKAEAVAEFIDSTGVAPDGVRPLLAKAWDEGNAVDRRFNAPTPNPYREVRK